MKKAVFNWSGGKNSALALQKVLEEKEFEVIALLTTTNKEREVRVLVRSRSSKDKIAELERKSVISFQIIYNIINKNILHRLTLLA